MAIKQPEGKIEMCHNRPAGKLLKRMAVLQTIA
jgi:hypothetical protein